MNLFEMQILFPITGRLVLVGAYVHEHGVVFKGFRQMFKSDPKKEIMDKWFYLTSTKIFCS